jgi:hypothetical protein
MTGISHAMANSSKQLLHPKVRYKSPRRHEIRRPQRAADNLNASNDFDNGSLGLERANVLR